MKSYNSAGGRNCQMNGAATLGETGALFPRLHVNETEKAGPRAPPRNKMALFEQFTVPSHRYVQPQPSGASTATANQRQFDYRPPYVAYYTPSSVPYSNAVSARPQPSHGVSSSCVTSSVSDLESQRATSLRTCEKYGLSRRTTKEGNMSSLLEEKAKVVTEETSMQSSPRAYEKMQGAFYTSSAVENISDKFASVSAESAEVPRITSTKNDMSIVGAYLADEDQGCGHDRVELNNSMEVSDAKQTTTENIQSIADAGYEHSLGYSSFTSDQSCQRTDVDRSKMLPEDYSHPEDFSHSNDPAKATSITETKTYGRKGDQSSSSFGNCLMVSAQSLSMNEGTHKICSLGGEKADASASADVLLKEKGESMGDSQNNQMGSNEVSELSQQGAGRGSDESPSSVLALQAIRPKDVIRAVGQQQFWKARKALLRQQRIFSDQVFQLHKLIKVQQLLAETPGTLINEEMQFGTVDHCAGSPSQCDMSEREVRHEGKAHGSSSLKERRAKEQADKSRKQPESMANPQWYAAAGNDRVGSSPYVPALTPGGVSAWGYPSLGMGQWMGQLPMQGRPSAYQPFAGAFPAGTPFGGLYGPGGLGPVPYCIPYTGQRSEPWEETSSSHGPHVAANPDTQVAPAFDHVAHDLSGAWHFVPYQNPYFNQRFYAGVPEKNVSTCSGASINDQSPVKPFHASGMEHTSGEASRAGRPNNNGLENSTHQSETSSPRNTSGFKFLSSPYMRPTPAAPKKAQQKTEPPAQSMNTSSVFRNFKSSKQHEANGGGIEEASNVEVRWPKRQQSVQVPVVNGSAEATIGRASDHGGNALDLFPLVPSLSTDGGQSSFKQTQTKEDWQGRVIKAVPHPAVAASQSAAGILLSLQRERQQ